jgi:NAD+ synthase
MMKQLSIALAQLNPTVGDITGNVSLILKARSMAFKLGADLMVCGELILSGYPPEDLVLK